MENEYNEYEVDSLNVAAYLYANGCKLITITPDPRRSRREIFHFDDSEGLAWRLCQEYEADPPTPARSLLTALGQLKQEAQAARQERERTEVR